MAGVHESIGHRGHRALGRGDPSPGPEGRPGGRYAEPNWTACTRGGGERTVRLDRRRLGGCADGTPDAVGPTGRHQFGSQAAEAWAGGQHRLEQRLRRRHRRGHPVNHPDLAANVWTNPSTRRSTGPRTTTATATSTTCTAGTSPTATTADLRRRTRNDHGTHVAGTIARRGPTTAPGVVGRQPGTSQLISGKFLGRRRPLAAAVKAIDYFTDLKTRHGSTSSPPTTAGAAAALPGPARRHRRADQRGSCSSRRPATVAQAITMTPRLLPVELLPTAGAGYDVIAVAAIDKTGGAGVLQPVRRHDVDLGAPGVDVWSTPAGSGFAYNGTSMATPHVTGAIALYAASTHAHGRPRSRRAPRLLSRRRRPRRCRLGRSPGGGST